MRKDMADATHKQGVTYLDYQATTPCDPRVVEEMVPYFSAAFGNPHSRNHLYGWTAEQAVEEARAQLASLIGADAREVVFTSGATEANNIAIKGVAGFYGKEKNHIITCQTEHKCVLNSCRHLEQEGFQVTYLPVDEDGLISLNALEGAITEKTCLVSIMLVNNEIGVIQPMKKISEICKERGVFLHTDAAQAVGKIPVDVEELNVDLLSLSGHKFYGPKGIGALYVRRKPRVRLKALISGGGQERGVRSGTLPTPLCMGIGKAAQIAQEEMAEESRRIQDLQTYMLNAFHRQLEAVTLNGHSEQRVPGNINVSFAHVEGEGLMMGIKELAVSSGSACTSASLEPSYVLRSLGVDEEMAHSSLRIGIGRFTTKEDVDFALTRIVEEVNRLRKMSPLWDMYKEGIDLKTIQWTGH